MTGTVWFKSLRPELVSRFSPYYFQPQNTAFACTTIVITISILPCSIERKTHMQSAQHYTVQETQKSTANTDIPARCACHFTTMPASKPYCCTYRLLFSLLTYLPCQPTYGDPRGNRMKNVFLNQGLIARTPAQLSKPNRGFN